MVQDGQFVELDANGNVDRTTPVNKMKYGDPWRLAGEIPVSKEIVDLCGLQDFDWFLYGLMRHAVGLVTFGFGDDPADVMSWFGDISAADYIVGGTYEVVGPERKPFEGLDGVKLVIDDAWSEALDPEEEPDLEEEPEEVRVLSGRAIVNEGNEFPFEYPIDDPEQLILAAFTISTVPSPGR